MFTVRLEAGVCVCPLCEGAPGPWVAIFASYTEWEERTEGGPRTGTGAGTGQRGGEQTGDEGAMSNEAGEGGTGHGSQLEGAGVLGQQCKQMRCQTPLQARVRQRLRMLLS